MKGLRALWNGDLALGDAFWTWAVFGGLLINATTSTLFLIIITLDQPWAALLLGYGISVPYDVVTVVGVWRSAERHDGANIHADLARGASLVLMIVLSVT